MTLRLGLVAYGTPTGLGYQTRGLFDHLHPDRTLLIDLSAQKGLPLHREWFPGADVVRAPALDDRACRRFVTGLDAVLVCETPLNYGLFTEARRAGVRTALQANPEFLDYEKTPHLAKPTVFGMPGPWMLDRMVPDRYGRVWPLPVPVDPARIPRREITEARTFLHIAGRPAARDRNGTLDYLQVAAACRDLDARWVLAAQSTTPEIAQALRAAPHVELLTDVPEPADLYARGDVLVLPRRYGGLSIPALEAVTTGMPVLMPDIPPNNLWLPRPWLTPAAPDGTFRAKAHVDLHRADLGALERTIRRLHATPTLATEWAAQARQIAARWTWDALLPHYRQFLDRLMTIRP